MNGKRLKVTARCAPIEGLPRASSLCHKKADVSNTLDLRGLRPEIK